MNTAQEVATDIARELRSNPAAWHQGNFNNGSASYGHLATAWCLSGHLRKRGHALGESVYDAFLEHIGADYVVCEWNDTPGRTVEEVIALCDRVAVSA